MANAIVRTMNALSDMNWGWWPFLYLRPQKSESLTTMDVAKMSAHYGPVIAAFLIVLGHRALTIGIGVEILLWSVVAFFVGFRLTFAIAWNVRAEELHDEKRP